MSTIRDVANLADVSIATVSRVLNNDTKYKMTDETRIKVLQAATQLNYRTNSKRKNKSSDIDNSKVKNDMKIGCVLSVTKSKYNDPFYMTILSGVESQLLNLGYEISFIKTKHELNDKKQLYNTFRTPITGLILMESLNSDTYEFIRKQVPYIVGIETQHEDIDNVGYDHYNAAKIAVQYLTEKGHKKIGYIGGSNIKDNIKESQRYKGFYSTMHASELSVNPDWVIDCGEWDEKLCMEKVDFLCRTKNYPTAFFVGSDLMAMAALSSFGNNGITVPNDLAIVGLSNIEVSKFSNPPLTTIDIPMKEIGIVAADLLIDRINGYKLLPKKVILPTGLIVRNSA